METRSHDKISLSLQFSDHLLPLLPPIKYLWSFRSSRFLSHEIVSLLAIQRYTVPGNIPLFFSTFRCPLTSDILNYCHYFYVPFSSPYFTFTKLLGHSRSSQSPLINQYFCFQILYVNFSLLSSVFYIQEIFSLNREISCLMNIYYFKIFFSWLVHCVQCRCWGYMLV